MCQPHPDEKNDQAQTIVAETATDRQIRPQGNKTPAAQRLGQRSDDRRQGLGKLEWGMRKSELFDFEF